MQDYIGVKLIQAVPVIKDGEPGYSILYPDGYVSWSPKEQFERAYLPITVNHSLCTPDIESMIASVQSTTVDPKTTLVNVELITGFKLYETASCVDEKNYNEDKGASIAMYDVQKKLWFAMGFLLQWAKFGLKNTNKNTEHKEEVS